jgi:hypothetical protein
VQDDLIRKSVREQHRLRQLEQLGVIVQGAIEQP